MRVGTVLVLAAPPVMAAAGAPAAEGSTATAEARAAYEEGVKAFRAGEYERALERFEHAYLLDNSPVLLYNVARANEELGRLEQAIYHFELYLKRVPDAEDRPEVERRIRVMRAYLARQAQGEKEPAATPAAASEEPEPPADDEPAAPADGAAAVADQPTEPPPSLRPYAYATLGLGVAGVGAGAFFAAQLGAASDEYDRARTPRGKRAAESDAESAATRANIAFIAGGALLAAGVTLWLLEPETPEAGVAIGPGYVGWRAAW